MLGKLLLRMPYFFNLFDTDFFAVGDRTFLFVVFFSLRKNPVYFTHADSKNNFVVLSLKLVGTKPVILEAFSYFFK